MLRIFCRDFLKILYMAACILLVQCFAVNGDGVFLRLGFVGFYKAGLITGIMLGFSILNVAGIFLWMFKITENREMIYALEVSGMNHMAAYVFISSFQMIQVLERQSRVIMNAQQARGVEITGSLRIRARAFFSLLVPLIIGAITGAEERVLTLQSKGFDIKGEKTHVFRIERSPHDGIARVTALIVTAAVLVLRAAAWLV
jgi:energy-coupling factor transporter transmembrane protein EcfT